MSACQRQFAPSRHRHISQDQIRSFTSCVYDSFASLTHNIPNYRLLSYSLSLHHHYPSVPPFRSGPNTCSPLTRKLLKLPSQTCQKILFPGVESEVAAFYHPPSTPAAIVASRFSSPTIDTTTTTKKTTLPSTQLGIPQRIGYFAFPALLGTPLVSSAIRYSTCIPLYSRGPN